MSAPVEIPPVVSQDSVIAGQHVPASGTDGSGTSGLRSLPLAIFISAFPPLPGSITARKEILPLFGGAPAVWTVCVLVFQLLFLAGYGYSHGLATRLSVRRQIAVHGVLLGLSALLLGIQGYIRSTPIGPGAGWRPQPGSQIPPWTIAEFLDLGRLDCLSLLLSATSPLMQHWFARTSVKRSPLSPVRAFECWLTPGAGVVPVFDRAEFQSARPGLDLGCGLLLVPGLLLLQRSKRRAAPHAAAASVKQKSGRDSHSRATPSGLVASASSGSVSPRVRPCCCWQPQT